MLGLARALAARGHQVHILATKLDGDAEGMDPWGCRWMKIEMLEEMNKFFEWDVLVSLRHPNVFAERRKARLRILWNQDLMDVDSYGKMVMAIAWALDKVVYVSEYHRKQWEHVLPELAPIGYATRNGFDPAHVPDPKSIVKDPNRIIHVSRPERGLAPLLEMWPAFKAAHTKAELHLCRYSSMYDAGGWGQVCAQFDRKVQQINAEVGGITYLGELNKAQLYHAIAEAAVMWYPGVPGFAETSCIASIESQACGTPFVGGWLGALPESVPNGVLIPGDAFSPEYQKASMEAVGRLLEGCARNTVEYRTMVAKGREHVQGYTYDVLAGTWEEMVSHTFADRYEANRLGVLRRLLHDDDHAAAVMVADDMISHGESVAEAERALTLCKSVIAGKEQVAEHYSERALDPLLEIACKHDRLNKVVELMAGRTRVLDVACGSGAFSLAMAQAHPDLRIVAVDYAEGNITAAKKAAEEIGVADRIDFICAPVWDYDRDGMSDWFTTYFGDSQTFDGVWCGEFIEHLGDTTAFVDALESVTTTGAQIVFSCPQGPLSEYLERDIPYNRGHVHSFGQADLVGVFGKKHALKMEHIPWGIMSPRGVECGNWLISYLATGTPTGERPFEKQILTTRPKAKLSIGILAKNAETTIGACLDVLWNIADEIIIGDTGCEDRTREIAGYYPSRVVKVVDIEPVETHPDGFAGARNDVLRQCTGDWFMWVDTDEVLYGAQALWQYLEGSVYVGYAIHQNHLQLDAPQHFDKPIRLFRKRPDIQFYGCVHEQPQMGDCNGDVTPSLEIFDTQIAHTGYMTHGVRRRKMLNRNLPLLERDQERYPDRTLGKLLVLRDYLNLCDVDKDESGETLSHRSRAYCIKAIALFQAHFQNPAHKLHDLARPFYEQALKKLGVGTEMEFALAGKPGGLQAQRAKPQRFWVRSPEEMEAIITHQVKTAADKMRPKPLMLEPIVPRPGVPDLVQTA
jgi:2-polyprenyl-3-methyl-5-hydroxy-6-metoxy-1,4-benzoquinol methylase/glycosyltransferase involved in cell wall biosynthesis